MRQPSTAHLAALTVVGVAALSLVACGTRTPESAAPEPTPAQPSSTPLSPPSSPTSSPPSSPPSSSSQPEDPAELVEHADNLYGTYVTRNGAAYQTRSLWGASCDHDDCTPAILVKTSSGSDADSYRVGDHDHLQRGIWRPRPPGAPEDGGCATSVDDVSICVTSERSVTRTDDRGRSWETVADPFAKLLMWAPLVSLATGVNGVVGGGDGATLFPFEQVARLSSSDHVATYRVGRPGGVMGYASGTVVLSDGRVLTLLADWSDDRGRYSKRHHGLWVSRGDNWSSYSPVQPVFEPPLTTPGAGTRALTALFASVDPDPVIWVQTEDFKVYVSTDDAATFRELRIR